MDQASGVQRGAVANWSATFSPEVEVVPRGAVHTLVEYIEQWQRVFPLGSTWVGRKYGVPSLFIRLDFVIHEGQVSVYEIEDRPCGFGVISQISPDFVSRTKALSQHWPMIRWVSSPTRETDDEPFFGAPLSLEEALQSDHPHLLVRSRPDETAYHELEHRSVSTVSMEGNKQYGVALGWWSTVTAKLEDDGRTWYLDPPLAGPCVLKPMQGTRSRDVKIYYPIPQGKKSREVITSGGEIESESRLTRLVATQPNHQMYVQPFIPPMRFAHQSNKNGIYRLMFGYNPTSHSWVPLGGAWNALHRLIVHGCDKTVFGPLHVMD